MLKGLFFIPSLLFKVSVIFSAFFLPFSWHNLIRLEVGFAHTHLLFSFSYFFVRVVLSCGFFRLSFCFCHKVQGFNQLDKLKLELRRGGRGGEA